MAVHEGPEHSPDPPEQLRGSSSEDAQRALEELLAAAKAERAAGGVSRAAGEEYQIIRFRSGGRDFAVPIDRVERTERIPLITPVPRSPIFVRGVASLRGAVVCVLDLTSFLSGGRATGEAKSLLVVTDGRRRVGVLSENMPDFERVQAADTMDVPPTELEIYSGAIERDGELVGIVDPFKLFEHVERRMVHAG